MDLLDQRYYDSLDTCIKCGCLTDYSRHVKTFLPLPTPHCLLCSIDLENEYKATRKPKGWESV